MKIDEKCVVTFHYKLTDEDGVELDSSAGREPLVYLHGCGRIIPGLESALEGKSPGERLQVAVQPEQAYGHVDPDLVQTVPHSAFQNADDVQPGMQFQAQGPGGQVQVVTVTEVSDEGVEVDANHPLAGQVLHFDVTVEDVRRASEEEIAHGHAH
jgi:FKBP-type peptidyl-prolyl cis-trans isomerase SlyD